MPRKLSVLLLVIVVGVLVVAWLRRSGGEHSVAVPKADAAHSDILSADLAASMGSEKERTEAAQSFATQPVVETTTNSGVAQLIARIVEKETGRPLCSVRVSLFPQVFEEGFGSAHVERSQGTMHESLRPDDQGVVDYAVPVGKGLRISVSDEFGDRA